METDLTDKDIEKLKSQIRGVIEPMGITMEKFFQIAFSGELHPTPKVWLTMEDVANATQLSTKTIYRQIKAGKWDFFNCGRRQFITKEDFDRNAKEIAGKQ